MPTSHYYSFRCSLTVEVDDLKRMISRLNRDLKRGTVALYEIVEESNGSQGRRSCVKNMENCSFAAVN